MQLRFGQARAAGRHPNAAAAGDPLDLLSADAPRALVRAAAARAGPAADDDRGFPRGDGGRWVIDEEAGPAVGLGLGSRRGEKRKRRPGGGLDDRASDDSDFDDLRGGRGGPGGNGASAKSVRELALCIMVSRQGRMCHGFLGEFTASLCSLRSRWPLGRV